jgi:hypothetical protein
MGLLSLSAMNHSFRSWAACISALFFLSWGLVAAEKNELEWEGLKVEKRVADGVPQVDGLFRFKNTSSHPVRIVSVTSSCGCTAGKLTKDVFAAGESGEVLAYFQVGEKRGKQLNTLTVKTDAGSSVRLEFVIEIYERMNLDSRFLVWNKGSFDAKEISISFEGVGRVEKLEIIGGTGFAFEVKPTDDPTAWRVVLSRISNNPLRTTCIVKAQTEKAGLLERKIFLQVR